MNPLQNSSLSFTRPDAAFSTERLQLAIYLHATRRLAFWGCEASENGKIRFLFEDAIDVGPEVELEFDRGAKVAATDLFASQKFLRRRMSEALNNRRIGNTDYEQNKRRCSRPTFNP